MSGGWCWLLGGPCVSSRTALVSSHNDSVQAGHEWRMEMAQVRPKLEICTLSISLHSTGQSKLPGQLTFNGWKNGLHLLMERATKNLYPFLIHPISNPDFSYELKVYRLSIE